jgi:hypothetical protein
VGAAAKLLLIGLLALAGQQEQKPVPKGSRRVSVPGCVKGYVFTAAERTTDEPGTVSVPEGTHIRMNGPKKLIQEIDAHKGSVIVLTGLMKEGQFVDGVGIGGNLRIAPPAQGRGLGNPIANQLMIDVEGWRPGLGNCPS